MKYVFLIHVEESQSQRSLGDDLVEHVAFARDAIKRGSYVTCAALAETSAATTVRVRGGRVITTDGPFSETREALRGLYILDCQDLDEAISNAARIPTATHGSVEVRALSRTPAGLSVEPGDEARASKATRDGGRRFLLLSYRDPDLSEPVDMSARHVSAVQRLQREQVYVWSESLGGQYMPVTVRVRNGKVLTTDGPYAETKELIGGFCVLDCRDRAEAVNYAANNPDATCGSVEIRPVAIIPGWEKAIGAARQSVAEKPGA